MEAIILSPILSVHNIDASIAFYVEKLGFEKSWSMPDEKGVTSFACVRLGAAEILLGTIDFVPAEDRGKLGTGIQIYVEVPAQTDIDTLYAQAREGGAPITRAIENRDWGERAFSVKDLDGYHLMLAQRPPKT